MICPKCNEGTLYHIRFRKSEKDANLCNFCGMVWFMDEDIELTAGRPIRSLLESADEEYCVLEELEKGIEYMPPRERSPNSL